VTIKKSQWRNKNQVIAYNSVKNPIKQVAICMIFRENSLKSSLALFGKFSQMNKFSVDSGVFAIKTIQSDT